METDDKTEEVSNNYLGKYWIVGIVCALLGVFLITLSKQIIILTIPGIVILWIGAILMIYFIIKI
ncbi:MAG: hypothetical protein ACW98D_18885 [Promethearchaeota archaeon]|jgi:hypothetical protein